MPSAAYIMQGWCVDVTWTPTAGGTQPRTHATGPWAALQFTLRFASPSSTDALNKAKSQMQDMEAQLNAATYSTPYLDSDQTWVRN